MTAGLAIGIAAGALLGAVHLVLFQRGVDLAVQVRRSLAARVGTLILSAGRLFMTATVGYILIQEGVSPVGLGIGLILAVHLHRAVLMGRRDGARLEGRKA